MDWKNPRDEVENGPTNWKELADKGRPAEDQVRADLSRQILECLKEQRHYLKNISQVATIWFLLSIFALIFLLVRGH